METYRHIAPQPIDGVFVLTILQSKLQTPETAGELQDELTDAITTANAEVVLLDFENVKIVSSVCLLSFLAIRRIPCVNRIVFCNLSPVIKSIFVTCGLISEDPDRVALFEAAETLDVAVSYLSTAR